MFSLSVASFISDAYDLHRIILSLTMIVVSVSSTSHNKLHRFVFANSAIQFKFLLALCERLLCALKTRWKHFDKKRTNAVLTSHSMIVCYYDKFRWLHFEIVGLFHLFFIFIFCCSIYVCVVSNSFIIACEQNHSSHNSSQSHSKNISCTINHRRIHCFYASFLFVCFRMVHLSFFGINFRLCCCCSAVICSVKLFFFVVVVVNIFRAITVALLLVVDFHDFIVHFMSLHLLARW